MTDYRKTIAIICGGRDYADSAVLFDALDQMMPEVVITGQASGADRLAGKWARMHAHMLVEVPALWDFYGKAAGPKRNAHMLALLQMMERNGKEPRALVIAFPGGIGTEGMIRLAESAGVEVMRVERSAF